MPLPEPDFGDPSVNESWRSAQRARQPVTIDAYPGRRASLRWAAYKHNWETAEFSTILAAIVILGMLPWAILVGGLGGLALWYAIFG